MHVCVNVYVYVCVLGKDIILAHCDGLFLSLVLLKLSVFLEEKRVESLPYT